jgi:hypothetical protein
MGRLFLRSLPKTSDDRSYVRDAGECSPGIAASDVAIAVDHRATLGSTRARLEIQASISLANHPTERREIARRAGKRPERSIRQIVERESPVRFLTSGNRVSPENPGLAEALEERSRFIDAPSLRRRGSHRRTLGAPMLSAARVDVFYRSGHRSRLRAPLVGNEFEPPT